MCYTTQLTQTQLFVLKSIAVKFKTPICIGNALQCSKYGACSLKNKGYTEWRTGHRFRHHTASMGSYETAAILFFYIESNWKLLMLLGIPNAISMQNFSLISRKLSVSSCIYVQHRVQVRAPVCTSDKCASWCPAPPCTFQNVHTGAQAKYTTKSTHQYILNVELKFWSSR